MDQLCRIADAGYKQDLTGEMEKAKNFFKLIDLNRDKKVSVKELIDKQIIPKDFYYVFNKFDTNGDGFLSSDEMSCLYYFKYVVPEQVKAYKPKEEMCKGSKRCFLKKALPDYSCFKCLTKEHGSYHICKSCYENEKHVNHGHLEWMLDRDALNLLYKMKDKLFVDNYKKDHDGTAGEKTKLAAGFETGVAVGTSAVAAAAAPAAGFACTTM